MIPRLQILEKKDQDMSIELNDLNMVHLGAHTGLRLDLRSPLDSCRTSE
jgi:hypothetical protein